MNVCFKSEGVLRVVKIGNVDIEDFSTMLKDGSLLKMIKDSGMNPDGAVMAVVK